MMNSNEGTDYFGMAVAMTQAHMFKVREKVRRIEMDADDYIQGVIETRANMGAPPFEETLLSIARVAFIAGWNQRDLS